MLTGIEATDIKIRSWRASDTEAIWSILKEGSYSNIKSTFFILLRRTHVRGIILLILGAGLFGGYSPLDLFLLTVLCVGFLYFVSFLSAVVYLYGPYLSDMYNIEQYYFSQIDHYFWVAECNGEIAGTIGIVRKVSEIQDMNIDHPPDQAEASVAWLRRMVVKKKYRGLGIAKRLVEESMRFCRNRGYTFIFLITTEAHHAARALYSKMGFVLTACKPYRYFRGLVVIETWEYSLRL